MNTPTPLDRLATTSLITAGVLLIAYALTAFVDPDWTIAGTSAAVVVAGVIGLKHRIAYVVGLLPIAALLSVAGPVAAYDLARPDETSYFVGSVAIVISAACSAVFGMAATLGQRRAGSILPAAVAAATVVTIAAFVQVIAASDASRATAAGLTSADRAGAVPIELSDFAFSVGADTIPDGAVVRLINSGALPHNFTVAQFDIAVFVPSGRETYLRLPASDEEALGMICTVGDHQAQGMGLSIPISRGA